MVCGAIGPATSIGALRIPRRCEISRGFTIREFENHPLIAMRGEWLTSCTTPERPQLPEDVMAERTEREVLHHLIEICKDGERGFRTAAAAERPQDVLRTSESGGLHTELNA